MEPVALGIKTPDTMSSLGQIMNVANGANQYNLGQQAISSNAMKLQSDTQANDERVSTNQFMSNPQNWQNDDGTINLTKITTALPKIAPQTADQTIQRLSTLAGAQTQANTAKTNMTTAQRALFAGPLAVLGRQGVTESQPYIDAINHVAAMYPNDPNMRALAASYTTSLSMSPPGWHLADGAIRASESLLNPSEAVSALAPKPGLQSTGSALVPTVTTPSVGGSQPTIAQGLGTPIPLTLSPNERQTPTPAGTTIIKSPLGDVTGIVRTPGLDTSRPPVSVSSMDISAPAQLPHTPATAANAGLRIPDASEAVDAAAGQQLRTGLVSHLNNTAETNNNLNESFKAITHLEPGAWYTSGAPGTVLRTLKNFVGSSDYQQLSKDLANVQLSQLQAQGGSMQTDAAKNLQAMASGTSTYNPDVLLNIMQRTQSKQIELQMQAPGLQAFSQKFGDANSAKFTQEWSKNADSKVFQAIAIGNSGMSKPDQQAAINSLLGSDSKARQVFFTKYNNINSLSRTGVLPAEAGQ